MNAWQKVLWVLCLGVVCLGPAPVAGGSRLLSPAERRSAVYDPNRLPTKRVHVYGPRWNYLPDGYQSVHFGLFKKK